MFHQQRYIVHAFAGYLKYLAHTHTLTQFSQLVNF